MANQCRILTGPIHDEYWLGMKVVRIPVAEARKNLKKVVSQAQAGKRIKLTRYNKTLVGLVGSDDLHSLEECERVLSKKKAKRAPVPRRKRTPARARG